MKRVVRISGTILLVMVSLCVVAGVFYMVLFSPFEMSDHCRGMPNGHQRSLCENFAATHQSQVPSIPPDLRDNPPICTGC